MATLQPALALDTFTFTQIYLKHSKFYRTFTRKLCSILLDYWVESFVEPEQTKGRHDSM